MLSGSGVLPGLVNEPYPRFVRDSRQNDKEAHEAEAFHQMTPKRKCNMAQMTMQTIAKSAMSLRVTCGIS